MKMDMRDDQFGLKVIVCETFIYKDASLMLNRQVLDSMKLPVVYIFAMPIQFDHLNFIREAIAINKKYSESIINTRLMIEQAKNGDMKKKSMVIYFRERDIAESFIERFNCWPLD